MKTKRTLSPLQIAIFFAIMALSLLSIPLKAQTIFQVNGRSLLLQNGSYYDVTSTDTMKVDIQNVIVKFNTDQINSGITNLENNLGLVKKKQLMNSKYHFKLPNAANFITTINDLLSTPEVATH